MRGSSAWVLALAAAALAAVGWLTLGDDGASQAPDGAPDGAAEEARAAGPTLAGRGAAKAVAPAPGPAAERVLEGRVLDAAGQPVADVPVAARRLREAYPEGDARAWRWDPRGQLEKTAAELAAGHAGRAAPVATTRSAADGTFRVAVPDFSEIELRAEPAPPLVGTHAGVTVNDKPPGAPTVLRVLPGSRLGGRVIDGQERGVAASLTATWSDPGRGTWSADPVRSDAASGAFELPAVPAGKLTLDLIVPGRVRLSGLSVTAPTEAPVVIRLGEAVPLATGRVTNLAGAPVAGATVALSIQDATAPGGPPEGLYARYLATTDAEGRYAVHGGHGGRLTQAEAAAPGYLYAQQQPPLAPWTGLVLASGAPAHLDLVLYQGGVLTGRVVERGGSAPLAGATLRVLPSAVDARLTRPPNLSATSDAEGRFRIEGLPLGRSLVLVTRDGWWYPPLESVARTQGSGAVMVYDGTPSAPPADLLVFVEAEGQVVERSFELVRGLPVRGRVVDERGAPVEGAEVVARGLGLGQAAWQWGVQAEPSMPALATSGPDGGFEVPGLPPRPAWVLQARKAPSQGEPSAPFALAAGSPPPEVALRLVPGATLVGRVIDAEGRPVAGAFVNAWPQTHEPYLSNRDTRSGEDGAWRLTGLPAGTVGVNASPPGGGGGGAYRQVDGLTPGETREGVELRLAAARTVAGVLVDEQGAPQRGKILTFVGRNGGHMGQTTSGADGSFSCASVTEEQVRILAGSWEAQQELTTVKAPATDLRVVWKEPPVQVIEGTVVDDKGRPVPVCQLSIRSASGRGPEPEMFFPGSQGQTVVNGWFRRSVRGRPPFTVGVAGAQDGQGRALNLKPRQVAVPEAGGAPLTIALEPGLTLAGRVLTPEGQGLPGVTVTGGSSQATTDAEGAFQLGGLAEGALKLHVRPPKPYVGVNDVPAEAGATDVVVRLRAGLAVAGVVQGPDGRPLTNGWVSASWPAAPGRVGGNGSAQVGSDGRFRVEGLPEDAVAQLQVQVWSADGADASFAPKTVTNVRAGTEDLVVRLAAGAVVEGVVVNADGSPYTGGGSVMATADGAENAAGWGEIQADGSFRLSNVAPGRVKVQAHRSDGGPSPEPLQADAPARGLRLVLPASTPVRGRLEGAGADASKFTVRGWTTDGGKRRSRTARVAADGTFTVEGLTPDADWTLYALAADDDRYALGGPVRGGAEGVVLTLVAGRAIEGTVSGADGGAPPPNTFVSAAAEGGGQAVGGRVDERGQFRLRGLPPGRYTVRAQSQDGSQQASEANVADGARGVRLELRPRSG